MHNHIVAMRNHIVLFNYETVDNIDSQVDFSIPNILQEKF